MWKKKKEAGKKSAGAFPDVQILNGQGTLLFEGPLQNLRFSEKLIIKKSIQFFHDPEPCFIHRSAVASRLFAELDLLLKEQPDISTEALEKDCPGYLDEYIRDEYSGAGRFRLKKAD
jgi:hypothetical protein